MVILNTCNIIITCELALSARLAYSTPSLLNPVLKCDHVSLLPQAQAVTGVVSDES